MTVFCNFKFTANLILIVNSICETGDGCGYSTRAFIGLSMISNLLPITVCYICVILTNVYSFTIGFFIYL